MDALNRLALSQDERAAHSFYTDRILAGLESAGIQPVEADRREASMGVMRDVQARRIPPNTKVPARRDVLRYLDTVSEATGSFGTALRCLMSPGSWTTSGGTHKLANDHGTPLHTLLEEVHTEQGRARFLEVGGGFAGLHGREKLDYQPKGIGEIIEHFGDRVGFTMEIHFTNLSQWHRDLPVGVYEHAGFIGSTIGNLSKRGEVLNGSVDVMYSQCAAYFDRRIGVFVEQAARLLRRSNKGGYLIFNGKTEEDAIIREAAAKNGLLVIASKVLGGMNGTFYILKKDRDAR